MAKSKMTRAKRKNKSRTSKKLVKKEYTEEEKARIANYLERSKKKPVKARDAGDDPRKPSLRLDFTDDTMTHVRMMETFGTTDFELQKQFLTQVINTFNGLVSREGHDPTMMTPCGNHALAMLSGIQPRDELEGMLALQMIGVHNMAMASLRDAMMKGQTFAGTEANVNYATKMARTFIAQIEALKKYRADGHQKIVVEHVHVNEGGQAIVGTVNTGGGGGNDENRR